MTVVTSASVQMMFAPAGLTGQIYGLQYGSGWSVVNYTGGDTVNLIWSGSVTPDSDLPPFALDMHFDETPTSFIASASSPQAASPNSLSVPAE
jgi:hypothetical protein